jgi:hypothetical protein
MEFKTASYANLLADSEPDDTRVPTNGRRDLQSSNVVKHDLFWVQNEQKMSFLKCSSEAITDPRLKKSIKTAINIAETTFVSVCSLESEVNSTKQQFPASFRVAPSKGLALTANNFNPLAAEFIPAVPQLPSLGSKLNGAAKEFIPSTRPSITKFNVNAAEFVPSSQSSRLSVLNANAPEFVPSPRSIASKLNRNAPEFVPSTLRSTSKFRIDASDFKPSAPAQKSKLAIDAPGFVGTQAFFWMCFLFLLSCVWIGWHR